MITLEKHFVLFGVFQNQLQFVVKTGGLAS
jgi:hypothetical protein